MRRKRILPTLASMVTSAYLLFSPQSTEAEQQKRSGRWYLGPTVEIGKPQTPEIFKQYFRSSLSFGANFGRVPEKNLTGDLILNNTTFIAKNNLPVEFKVFSAGLELRVFMLKPDEFTITPYFAAGAYYAHAKTRVPIRNAPDIEESENRLGIEGGAGALFFAGSSAFIDLGVRYHRIATSDEPTDYASLNARLNFLLGKPK